MQRVQESAITSKLTKALETNDYLLDELKEINEEGFWYEINHNDLPELHNIIKQLDADADSVTQMAIVEDAVFNAIEIQYRKTDTPTLRY